MPARAWPFSDPPNTASITTRHVLEGTYDIVFVTHDVEDGMWQFLPRVRPEEADARVVGISTVTGLDPTVSELADLPLGWQAVREERDAPWHRTAIQAES